VHECARECHCCALLFRGLMEAMNAGRRPVALSALVTLCSFHAAAAAVLLLDPNCSWVPEVGGDVGRLWGSVYDLALARAARHCAAIALMSRRCVCVSVCVMCVICDITSTPRPRYLHAGMALGIALVGLGGGGKNKRGVRDAGAGAAKAPSKKTQ
jgi:hypothetical protein